MREYLQHSCFSSIIVLLFLLWMHPSYAQDTQQNRGLILKKNGETLDELQYYENKYAVIVGINQYKDADIPHLNYADNDAQSIKKMLIHKFNYQEENIRLLLNEEATKFNIQSALSALRHIDQNSQVLFYFAGHGQTIQLPSGGEMGVLLPYDANDEDLYVTGLRMKELSDVSYLVAAKHQLFLVDACYGGLAAVTSRALNDQSQRYLGSLLKADARQIITAGGRGQQVIEKSVWGHSAFAKVLLDGLNKELADTDGNGLITADELAAYMKPKVNAFSDGRQTPVYRRFTPDEGDFIFLLEDLTKEKEKQAEVKTSTLTIHSEPTGAEVLLDSSNVGTTPLTIDAPYGRKDLRIRKKGYADYTRSITLSDPASTINASLKIAQASVTISANVDSANVYLDGEVLGTTPYEGKLDTGKVVLEVYKEGYLTYNKTITVQRSGNNIHAELKKAAGISLQSQPSDAEVYINGSYWGQTPVSFKGLQPDLYEITFKKEGYPKVEKSVDLTSTYHKDVSLDYNDYMSSLHLKGLRDEVQVGIEGRNIAKNYSSLPVTVDSLLFGQYALQIKKQGFKAVETQIQINNTEKQVNVVPYMEPKSKFGSIMLSLVVPGGGQFYMDKYGRGILFLITESIFAGYTYGAINDYQNKVDAYEHAQSRYENATSNFDQLYNNMQQAYDERAAAKKDILLGAGIFGGLKFIELLDNLFYKSPKKQLEKARVEFNSTSNTLSLQFNF